MAPRVFEPPRLDLVQLLELQRRLPRMQVSFHCYVLSKANSKPIYWDMMTEDLNDMFSAKVAEGPLVAGAPPLPFVQPRISKLFANRSGYELSLVSRWPVPGSWKTSYPAIVLNVGYDASKDSDFPFAQKPSSKDDLKATAETLWSVDEICATTDENSPSHKQEIMFFIYRTGLCCTLANEWFLNFRWE